MPVFNYDQFQQITGGRQANGSPIQVDLSELTGLSDGEQPGFVEDEDGGVTFLEDEAPDMSEHGANLAEVLDQTERNRIGTQLLDGISADLESRSEWEETYKRGLKLLGVQIEEEGHAFEGASAVTHPVLHEAVIQFQARALAELLPPEGPAKVDIVGQASEDIKEQRDRVEAYTNYWAMVECEEYFGDVDQLLYQLPIAGTAFKKTYYDPLNGRVTSRFIPAEDLIVSYTATDVHSGRVSQYLQMQAAEIERLMHQGFYRDVDLDASDDAEGDADDLRTQKNEIAGRTRKLASDDEVYELYEAHCDLEIPGDEDTDDDGEATGIPLPYVVTIEKDSGTVLSIYRNWKEGDDRKRRQRYFTTYRFLPALSGVYGHGLVHLIGNLSKAATETLRQLVDAGTLSNLPAGFKTTNTRFADNDQTFVPGEWKDVDTDAEDVSKAFFPLPFKGPDASLLQLLMGEGGLVENARRLAQIADMNIGDMRQDAPVGSTLAAMDQANRVLSAIHKRLHNAQRQELKRVHELFAHTLPDEYPFKVKGADQKVARADFDDRVDVVPVSDPDVTSKAERIALAQTKMQMAQQAPQLHDMRKVYEDVYNSLGIDNVDEIMPEKEGVSRDPATENKNALAQRPLKADIYQNHDAHVAAHMQFMQMVINAPQLQQMAQQTAQALQAHIAEHIALKYMAGLSQQTGIQLEKNDDDQWQFPEQAEQQAAQATAQFTAQFAQQYAPQTSPQQQQKMAELQQKEKDSQRKHQRELMKMKQDLLSKRADLMQQAREHDDQMAFKQAEMMQNAYEAMLDDIQEQQDARRDYETEVLRINADLVKQARENRHDEQMSERKATPPDVST